MTSQERGGKGKGERRRERSHVVFSHMEGKKIW
jgi:hypothetical protein